MELKFADQNAAILGLISKLTAKIEGIDVSVAERVCKSLEGTIEDKVDARVGSLRAELLQKITSLEEDVKFYKNKADVAASNSGNPKADDDASSNELVRSLTILISVLFFF